MARRRQQTERREFVLEIGERAVLALLGDGIEQMREFCSQPWFTEELACYRSGGRPIWDGTTELRIRHATAHEAAELKVALGIERGRQEYQGYVFVFFLPVDAALH